MSVNTASSVNIATTNRKRVVIVGGGFGGLKLARALRTSPFQVVLIDRNNYHQFLPLIYQVASSGIEGTSITFPFRKLFRRHKNFHFRMTEVHAVNTQEKTILTSIGKLHYDYLVLAAGATTNYFGNKNIQREAIPMKTLTEAMGLRNALLSNLERSVTCATEQERRALLNIVIAGGGATGVEIAGALSEMKRYVLPADYPDINTTDLHIHLVEASGRLLAGLSEISSKKAEKFLRKMGVNILLHSRVEDFKENKVLLEGGTEIPTRTFIWVSGIRGTDIKGLEKATGHGGRIKVNQYNQVEGIADIFAIGDQCLMTTDEAYPQGHPQLAQAAIQQGQLLANNLVRMQKGHALQAFHYRNLGAMATIGRNKAVAEFNKIKTQGFLAWILWGAVHLRSILGVRNKLIVLINWIWNYLTYDQSLRVIMSPENPHAVPSSNPTKPQTPTTPTAH